MIRNAHEDNNLIDIFHGNNKSFCNSFRWAPPTARILGSDLCWNINADYECYTRAFPAEAKKLKLADKICNITDIIHYPPHDWDNERKLKYLSWAEEVMDGLKGVNAALENHLSQLIAEGREKLK